MSFKVFHFPELRRRFSYSPFRRYRDFRQEIRVDCQGRCGYCDAHENEIGGEKYMTLDHFRPKDKYPHLKHNPTNLVWACTVCNRLKDNTWPAYGTPYTVVNGEGFINRFEENLWDYFDISSRGELLPLKSPAKWMIDVLELNRDGVRRIREIRNQKFERKKKFEAFYDKAVRDVETLLRNPHLSEEEKDVLRKHKEVLEQQHIISMESCEPDFNLY